MDCHLTNVINQGIELNSFSEFTKVASVKPLYKKRRNVQSKIKHYRPVSILNAFSKIYETYLHNSLTPFINKVLSGLVSACRKSFGSNHILIRVIEVRKKYLDNKNIVGTVLIDLPKAFDCIPHDLLTAKMSTYGFSMDTLVLCTPIQKEGNKMLK